MNAVSAAIAAVTPAPILRWLGRAEYESTWHAMQRHVDASGPSTPDELWFLEHPPVFTMGMNARSEHLLAPGDIPVVNIDRGGQVTYHGPGQLVVYPLLDLPRLGLGVRGLVVAIERAISDTVAEWGIAAAGRRDAPGVYVDGRSSRASGCGSVAAIPIMGSRSTWQWTSNPFAASIPAATRGSR